MDDIKNKEMQENQDEEPRYSVSGIFKLNIPAEDEREARRIVNEILSNDGIWHVVMDAKKIF